MRIAALYDVHGNLPALEAVLAEIGPDVDRILFGGDIVMGFVPAATLARVLALGERAVFLRGNTDREVATRAATVGGGGEAWVAIREWVAEQLTAESRAFLGALPTTVTLDVDGLGPVLFCHGSPRSDEEIMTRLTSDERSREIFTGVSESVVVCGHTHVQFDRVSGGKRVVNAGSVGMPYEGAHGAYWALLGPDVTLRRTDYDRDAALARFRASGMPGAEALIERVYLNPYAPDAASELFERMAIERATKS